VYRRRCARSARRSARTTNKHLAGRDVIGSLNITMALLELERLYERVMGGFDSTERRYRIAKPLICARGAGRGAEGTRCGSSGARTVRLSCRPFLRASMNHANRRVTALGVCSPAGAGISRTARRNPTTSAMA
jgi:hypothetical protein